MDRHVAAVTQLESFDFGKNTAQNAGIEIKIFDRGAGKRGWHLGTIRIGQGSFAWWATSAKIETKKGKRKPTLRLGWSRFAELMKQRLLNAVDASRSTFHLLDGVAQTSLCNVCEAVEGRFLTQGGE